jgi:hypothetical protein
LVERNLAKVEVAGSSPVARSIKKFIMVQKNKHPFIKSSSLIPSKEITMKTTLSIIACVAAICVLAGCANSVSRNQMSTGGIANLEQNNFIVVASGVKGQSEMTLLGIRMLDGQPFGIPLSGDKLLTTAAMDQLRARAGLLGKPRALINVTEELEYDPWFIIWHRVRKTITADVVEFR